MEFAVVRILGLTLGLAFCQASGQNTVVHVPLSGLRQLNRSSGYIFDGTVLSVQPLAPNAAGVATVQITFRVDQAIRGTRSGQVLTIREWAGLWNSGQRYRRGERLLLFLYSPGNLGLTSPVGGQLGRFAVDASGSVMLDERFPELKTLPRQWGEKKRMNARSLALAIQQADAE